MPVYKIPSNFFGISCSPFASLFFKFPSMKRKEKSASSGELVCQHLRDHPTRQAKPNNQNHTDELCTFPAVGADARRPASFPSPGGEDTDEGVLYLHSPQSRNACPVPRGVAMSQCLSFPSQVLDFTLFHSFSPRSIAPQLSNLETFEPSNVHPSTGTYPARELARSVAHNDTQKPLKNTLWHTKTRSFFQIIFSPTHSEIHNPRKAVS